MKVPVFICKNCTLYQGLSYKEKVVRIVCKYNDIYHFLEVEENVMHQKIVECPLRKTVYKEDTDG